MKPVARCLGIGLIAAGVVTGVAWLVTSGRPRPLAGIQTPQPDGLQSPKGNSEGHSSAPKISPIRFSLVPNNGGITYRHQTGTSPEKPFPAANGSGIAAIDFDRDGYQDLYFATGTPFPIDLNRSSPHSQIYRNRGEWQFHDVTAQTGVGHNGYTAGLAVGDYDNDGFPDLFLSCYGPDVLFRNCGDGTFERVVSGVEDPRWGTSATFLDYDQDGNLDLYVCNYGEWTLETNQYCGNREKNVRIYCSPHTLEGVRSSLFHNLGNGQFADVTEGTSVGARIARSQGVIAADFNQDGLTDLYVGNDLHANSLFINAGQGRFEDATELSGTGYNERGQMQAGMGVDVADITGDGNFELFVTNFEGETNTLYEYLEPKVYRDSTPSLGLAAESLPWVGWGCAIRDFDLDGADDIWVVNGHVDDNLKLLGKDATYLQPSLIWHQEQGKFRTLGPEIGEYFKVSHPARALAIIDLDNDGDWDAVIGHQDESPALLRNDHFRPAVSRSHRSVELELIGRVANRSAIGATVTVHVGKQRIRQPVRGGGSYLSAPDTRLIFALPEEQSTVDIEIHWPGGHRSRATVSPASGFQQIVEPNPSAERDDTSALPQN